MQFEVVVYNKLSDADGIIMARIGIRLLFLSFLLTMVLIVLSIGLGFALQTPILSFSSTDTGNRDIYLFDFRTHTLHNLTETIGSEWSYVWSQDGQQIIYNVPVGAGDDIYMMSATGRNKRQIEIPTLQAWNLTWSPDGQSLAYFSSYYTSDLFLISLRDNTVENITDSLDISESLPQWSSNEENLLFFMGNDMFLRDVETDSVRRLTDTPHNKDYPLWSPDGEKIAFQRNVNGNNTLFIFDLDSGAIRPLALDTAIRSESVSWSPDSQQVTMVLDTQQVITYSLAEDIYEILTDGTNRTASATWSPDGRYIAYLENRLIQVYDLERGRSIQLELDIPVLAPIIWQP